MQDKLAALALTITNVAASGLFWMLACGLSGIGFLIVGTYVLAGWGFALLVAGVASLGVAAFIRQGLTDG